MTEKRKPRIVVLTGAGISKESGIATFRDVNGLWNDHQTEDVASPQGFASDPILVHNFYNARRRQDQEVLPNPAHFALADLESDLNTTSSGSGVLVVTQNVDDLHERAGSRDVIHIHGELTSALCTKCGQRHRWLGDLNDRSVCSGCGQLSLRPDIVWFGEQVYHLDEIQQAVRQCEIFLVVGTSASVWPAAGLTDLAKSHGAKTILINAEPHDGGSAFDEVIIGDASLELPEHVYRILDDDFDPEMDFSEQSADWLRTTIYVDLDVLTDRPIDFVEDGIVACRSRDCCLVRGKLCSDSRRCATSLSWRPRNSRTPKTFHAFGTGTRLNWAPTEDISLGNSCWRRILVTFAAGTCSYAVSRQVIRLQSGSGISSTLAAPTARRSGVKRSMSSWLVQMHTSRIIVGKLITRTRRPR